MGITTIENMNDFICEYYQRQPNGHFFDTNTLRFFGETRSSMRVLKKQETVTTASGTSHVCYVVSALQTDPYSGKKRRVYHYFDVNTLEDVPV